jgi:hypothetical protein
MSRGNFRGISFPFRFNSLGGVATSTVETGNPAHILESIRQIVGTRRGERVMRPEFGADADNLVFSPQSNTGIQIATHNIGQQLLRWEKRVDLQKVEVVSIDDLQTEIDLDVRIRVTREIEEMKIPMKKEE